MKIESNKSSFLLAAIVGIVVIVLVITGLARLMGSHSNPLGGIGTIKVVSAASAEPVETDLPQVPDNVRGKRRCPECGVIMSMRGIGPDAGSEPAQDALAAVDSVTRGLSAERFEFVVRLQDGSRRVIIGADSASWRLGERVIVIDGASPVQR